MLDDVRPELAGQPIDLSGPIWNRTANLIALQEQAEKVGFRPRIAEQQRKQVLLRTIPSNEIPMVIEEVCGIRIEGIDETLVARIRRRH